MSTKSVEKHLAGKAVSTPKDNGSERPESKIAGNGKGRTSVETKARSAKQAVKATDSGKEQGTKIR